jgi:SPOR domain
MKYLYSLLFAYFFSTIASLASDTIVVHKDPRLDVLNSKQATVNKRAGIMTSSGMYKGYRVQIISTSNRDEAFNLKASMMSKYSQEKTYVLFQAPSFRVRIGNFLKKADADKFRKEIAKGFKQGIYVVEDIIEYTPPATEEEQDIEP